MNDQELSGGAPAPDANASQATDVADAATPKPGSEADSSPAAKDQGEKRSEPDGRDEKIKELTRRWREEQRRSDRLMRNNEELSRRSNPPQQAPAQQQQPHYQGQQPQYQGQPQVSTNPNDIAELATQKAKEFLREQEAAARREAYEDREAAFAATVEDFDEVTYAGPDPEHSARWACSPAMADAIYEIEEGPALKYYLAKNPDVASKLAKLSPVQAVREMTRIEDRLVTERKSAAQKSVSQAPPPAPQIEAKESSTRVSTTSPESDSLSDEEWVKAENARLRRKANRKSD